MRIFTVLFFLSICNIVIFPDVIITKDQMMLNGKIINLQENKTEEIPDSLILVNSYGRFKINKDNILKYWITSTAEEDVKIYKGQGEEVSEETETVIKKNFEKGKEKLKEVRQARNKIQFKFDTPRKKAGLALLCSGGTLTLSGLIIFIYDTAGYFSVVEQRLNIYKSDINNETLYESYEEAYNINLALFSSSLTILGIGVGLLAVSFPLMFIKDKENKTSLNINFSNKLDISIKISI